MSNNSPSPSCPKLCTQLKKKKTTHKGELLMTTISITLDTKLFMVHIPWLWELRKNATIDSNRLTSFIQASKNWVSAMLHVQDVYKEESSMETQVYTSKTWGNYQRELHSVQRLNRSSWTITKSKSGTLWEGKITEGGKVKQTLKVRVWVETKKKIRDKSLSTQ